MARCAMDGTHLAKLMQLAIPVCQAAQRQCPRTGPGRPPKYDDWKLAVIIMVTILKKRKSKSAQYRFLSEYRNEFMQWLDLPRIPSRSSYFERYRQMYRIYRQAIKIQGRKAIKEHIASAETVAVDKSLVKARGPLWHKTDRKKGRIPDKLHGVDIESTWGFSKHHGWVQGYSYEVVVSAEADSTVFPLLASVDTASVREYQSFAAKIDDLPRSTRNVLADSGYDSCDFGRRIEYDKKNFHTGRRFICPPNPRNQQEPKSQKFKNSVQQHRQKRISFYLSPPGQQLYAQRSQTVEPFNDWFKSLFELDERVWHYGLQNNQTQILAAIFCYQLLLRYNRHCGRKNGQIKWVLDTL